ncbi:predicted protein [Thalassiosira pseudonana CCMP1335]|uniref:Uncharacterized protein n=1 Tax=Thalassiosira pseudonana TaxID=35128 RepID=B8CFF9_THAPS|nr:predicted protein [Thalassiosira pseudonana CCMP1335]EED87622.1 predicted protein [Thalassiosira pseudonana CCMP1335]
MIGVPHGIKKHAAPHLTTLMPDEAPLTPQQIASYLREGILVVDNLLSPEELSSAHHGLVQTLRGDYGVDVHHLEETGHGLMGASSTNGAGGVLDVFYPEWKMKIATNETLFQITCQLWKAAYCHDGEELEDLLDCDVVEDKSYKWHPFGAFDCNRGYMPNTGGFEAVPGFHREFRSWVESGRKSMSTTPHRDGDEEQSEEQQQPHPQPCVGEYTHLNPTHDRELIRRIQHIPVKAGSVVFWDNRIPHGNSYRNDPPLADDDGGGETNSDYSKILGTSGSRAVVYCSFLPDVDINRIFVGKQLQYWKMKRSPRVGDRWIKQEDEGVDEKEGAFDAKGKQDGEVEKNEVQLQLTDLGQRLIGLLEW